MTYDRRIGRREAGSGKFGIIYGFAGLTRGTPARQWPSAVSLKKADPGVSRKQLAGRDGF